MARKNTVNDIETNAGDHVVSYTDPNTHEKITATFGTKEHSTVLRNRLRSHGIVHDYSGPGSDEPEVVTED